MLNKIAKAGEVDILERFLKEKICYRADNEAKIEKKVNIIIENQESKNQEDKIKSDELKEVK